MNNDTQLIADLVKCVDMLMPGIGHIVADIGLLNDTLIAARRRAGEHTLQTTLRDNGELIASRATVAQQAELLAYKDQVIEQRNGEISRLKACPVWAATRYSIEAGDGPGIYPQEDPEGEWCRVAEVHHVPEDKLLVTSTALRTVLEALIGPPHHIRELLATREPPELFPDNPINKLIAEFNAFHATGGAR